MVNSMYFDGILVVRPVVTKFAHSLPTAGYDFDAT